MGSRFVLLSVVLEACARRAPPPPYPPPPPSPAAYVAAMPSSDDPSFADTAPDLPSPRATGDRERDALEMGFWGCRVMGLRLVPALSGRATLRARLSASGEVLDVVAETVDGLPRPVVDCLLTRVAHVRFDPRGGYGSILRIPVDFTRPAEAPRPVLAPGSPSRSS